jgi:hypothetical protein
LAVHLLQLLLELGRSLAMLDALSLGFILLLPSSSLTHS